MPDATKPGTSAPPMRRDDAAGVSWSRIRERLLSAAANNPAEALATVVLASSVLYYLAEKDENPRVSSFSEALWCMASSLTVGSDVTRTTPVGRIVGSFVMVVGSTLQNLLTTEAVALRKPAPAAAATSDVGISARLDEIAALLRQLVDQEKGSH